MAKNQLYSYEYIAQSFRARSESGRRCHRRPAKGSRHDRRRQSRLRESQARSVPESGRRPGHLLQTGRPDSASEHHAFAAADDRKHVLPTTTRIAPSQPTSSRSPPPAAKHLAAIRPLPVSIAVPTANGLRGWGVTARRTMRRKRRVMPVPSRSPAPTSHSLSNSSNKRNKRFTTSSNSAHPRDKGGRSGRSIERSGGILGVRRSISSVTFITAAHTSQVSSCEWHAPGGFDLSEHPQ